MTRVCVVCVCVWFVYAAVTCLLRHRFLTCMLISGSGCELCVVFIFGKITRALITVLLSEIGDCLLVRLCAS